MKQRRLLATLRAIKYEMNRQRELADAVDVYLPRGYGLLDVIFEVGFRFGVPFQMLSDRQPEPSTDD